MKRGDEFRDLAVRDASELAHKETGVMSSKLYNEDLAPTGPEQRTWTTYNLAALWVGMAIVITTYTLDSGLVVAGISWWQALLTISLGNVIVLIPMILNAHAGTKYGVPFPIFVRSSFGVKGANVAAMARALGRRQVHSYSNGHNWRAIDAVLVGVVPVVPGFLKAATPGGTVENPRFIDSFYTFGLFFTFGVAAVAYPLMSLLPGRFSVRQNPDVRVWESMGGGPPA